VKKPAQHASLVSSSTWSSKISKFVFKVSDSGLYAA
jgi:hypothetical protein